MADKTSFIKLDRNILRWRWYKAPNVFRVFLYLLVTAAYRDSEIKGIKVKRGQCLTTYRELSEKHKLSLNRVRGVMKKLKESGEISVKRLSHKQLITITNYELYQGWYKFAFFVDMTGGQSLSPRKGQSQRAESVGEKNPEKQLDNYFYNILNNDTPPPTREVLKYIVSIFNNICTDYPPVKVLSAPMEEELLRSLKLYSLDQFKEVFAKAESSHYLRGKNPQKRRANFDWIIKAENMAKILNGNYDDPQREGSFDTDEAFKAALEKSYKNIGGKKDE